MFFELCLGIGVGVLGTILAAHISDPAGAAFALANQISAMLFILFRVVGAGVSVVVAQSLGSGRRDAADAVARAVLGASSWVGIVTALMAFGGAYPLLHLMQAPRKCCRLRRHSCKRSRRRCCWMPGMPRWRA